MIKQIKNFLYKNKIEVKRILTPEKIYQQLKKESHEVQFYELKKIGKRLKAHQDHKYYNTILKLFIPDWNLNIQKAEFIGKGYGEDNINIYRKVDINNTIYFEKVYFSNSSTIKKLEWFKTHLFEILKKENFNTVNMVHLYENDLLSIAYFGFIDLTFIPENEIEQKSIRISKKLYNIPIYHIDFPKQITNINDYIHVKKNIEQAKIELRKQRLNFKEIDSIIKMSPIVLTHGDLKKMNLYQDNTLIDWDLFGFFPIGLEQGYIFYRNYYFNNNFKNNPIKWLKDNFSDMISDKMKWVQFEFNFIYFLFVISLDILICQNQTELKSQLLRKLKSKLELYKSN